MHKLIVILLCLWLVLKFSAPQMVYKFTNIECRPNHKFVVNETCFLKALNWNRAVAQMDCYIVVPMRNFSVQLELFKRNYNNRYLPFLVNVTVNMCDIIAKRNFLPYGTILWKNVKDLTNMNHSCPFVGHIMARNLYIDETLFPVFPHGYYMFSMNVIENYANRPSDSFGIIKFQIHSKEKFQLIAQTLIVIPLYLRLALKFSAPQTAYKLTTIECRPDHKFMGLAYGTIKLYFQAMERLKIKQKKRDENATTTRPSEEKIIADERKID